MLSTSRHINTYCTGTWSSKSNETNSNIWWSCHWWYCWWLSYTNAAIAGTTIVAAAAGHVVAEGAGVVAGAVGVGFAANKVYSWIAG